jgi:hypothetical protein
MVLFLGGLGANGRVQIRLTENSTKYRLGNLCHVDNTATLLNIRSTSLHVTETPKIARALRSNLPINNATLHT